MTTQNPDSTVTPPEVIEHKGRIAKIYRAKNRDRYRYEVKYRDPDGAWKRETFDEPDAARKHANHVVKQLDAASQPFLMLRGKERFIYERALDLLRPTGLVLDMAVAEFVEAKAKLKDVCTLREAAETTRNLRSKPVSTVTVKQVVDEFVKVKDTEGLSHLYRRDLRTRLARFADYFKCPLSAVTTPDLVRFLNGLGGSRRHRRNYLTTIGTLMNHCKMMGHLPDGHPGIAKIPKPRKDPREIAIAPVEVMRTLLSTTNTDVKLAVALGGFSGLRSEEIKRLRWEHIKFDEGHIEVTAQHAKTGVRRLVPLTDNLRAWLMPHRKRDGKVIGYVNLSNQFEKVAKRLQVEWKRNFLRHSFISYRVAVVKNLPQVAMEAGNSVGVIQRDYLKVVTEERGKEWFSIFPSMPDNLVALPVPVANAAGEHAAQAATK
jgi:integrase